MTKKKRRRKEERRRVLGKDFGGRVWKESTPEDGDVPGRQWGVTVSKEGIEALKADANRANTPVLSDEDCDGLHIPRGSTKADAARYLLSITQPFADR